MRKMTIRERLEKNHRVEPETGCWLWTGHINPRTRYGAISLDHIPHGAHRVSYEEFVGPISEGLVIDHLCRVRHCINPSHLEVVTMRENLLRGESFTGVNSRKTHCIHGHEFSPSNTYIRPDGHRACRICLKARKVKWRKASSTNRNSASAGTQR